MCAYNLVMEEQLIRLNLFMHAIFLAGRADRPKKIAGTNKNNLKAN